MTHPPPTVFGSQPDHHQNVHYSTKKSDEEPIQSKFQNVHYSPKEKRGAATDFEHPRKEKRETKCGRKKKKRKKKRKIK